MERWENLRRSHNLMIGLPLPSKDVVLKVTKTKVRLISLIADDLLNHFRESPNRLVVTSANESPEQVQGGTQIIRSDICTFHEEADVIIPQQIMYAI